ncbi:MAG TPA: type VI secretion system contractile sheath large subunit [Pirellulales bacterium]|nr:type VI secretion system contractile sheath large subunit [Pirellulales bacterium]
MSGHIDLSFSFGKPQPQAADRGRPNGGTRILVLGDFSGDARERSRPLAERRPLRIDVDNFDEVLSRLAPCVACPAAGPSREAAIVEFRSLDEFHPDHLYRTLPVFAALRDLRRRLLDPKTFHEAAEALHAITPVTAPQDADEPPAPSGSANDVVALGLLPGASDRAASARPGQAADDFHEWINQIVAPHLVPAADPSQNAYLNSIDEAIASLMRRVLHDRPFQTIEAAWRGLVWLVRSLTGDDAPHVFLLDVTKSELAADIERAGDDVRTSAVFRLLVDDPASEFGEEPWPLLVGDYTFGPRPDDMKLLAVMGAIASHAGGPFVAAACPEMIGCQKISDLPEPSSWAVGAENLKRWQALRGSPVAAWLGLAMPRILLRAPYGNASDPIEEFAFEEVTDPRQSEDFLWGNPALACAIVAGRCFAQEGRSAVFAGPGGELEDLPVYIYKEAGHSEMMSCAEGRLTDRGARAIFDAGVMPLVCHKNQNIVALPHLRLLGQNSPGTS